MTEAEKKLWITKQYKAGKILRFKDGSYAMSNEDSTTALALGITPALLRDVIESMFVHLP